MDPQRTSDFFFMTFVIIYYSYNLKYLHMYLSLEKKREEGCGDGSVGKAPAPASRRASVQISRTQENAGHATERSSKPSLARSWGVKTGGSLKR